MNLKIYVFMIIIIINFCDWILIVIYKIYDLSDICNLNGICNKSKICDLREIWGNLRNLRFGFKLPLTYLSLYLSSQLICVATITPGVLCKEGSTIKGGYSKRGVLIM